VLALENLIVKKMVDVVARAGRGNQEPTVQLLADCYSRLCPQLIQLNPVVIPELQVIQVLMQWWQLQD
jgi:hypothetical protein